jgi:enoyl-CoA hydratase/carnithine racemase
MTALLQTEDGITAYRHRGHTAETPNGPSVSIELPNDSIRVNETDDRVEVWIERPTARNAIDQSVLVGLNAVLDSVEQRPRFLIITGGTQGIFAAGADLRELRARQAAEALHGPNARLYERLTRAALPTVAAVDGYALGGGAELALACDFRVATVRAIFGQPEAGLGVLAAGGATWRLPALVGEPIARRMLMLGLRLKGADALSAGLVDDLVDDPADLLPAAHRLIDKMKQMSEFSLRLTKIALAMPAGAHPEFELVAQGLLYEEGSRDALIDAFLARNSHNRGAREPSRHSND